MGFSDEQKDALLRLKKACAEVQQALDILLKEDGPSPASGPAEEELEATLPSEEESPFTQLLQFREEAIQAGINPEEVRFAQIAPERFPDLPEEKQRRLLGDCLRFLDKIQWKYHFLLSDAQKERGRNCLSEITTSMGVEHEQIHLFSGSGTPACNAFEEAMKTVTREKAGGMTNLLEEVMKLWDKLAHADEEQELLLLRYAINTLQPLGSRGIDLLSTFLSTKGIREVPAQIGAIFDESYSPGRYERRRIKSSAPRDSIVQVHQRGFLGQDGVPLQRAIVSVSDGEA